MTTKKRMAEDHEWRDDAFGRDIVYGSSTKTVHTTEKVTSKMKYKQFK